MKREEALKSLEQNILWRKDAMIRSVESELKYLEKYLEELKKSETVDDVLNNSRIVTSYAENVKNSAATEYGSMNELRLGLYYLHGIEE